MNLLTPEINVTILTWIAFFALLAVLYKYAWNPILEGLNKREAYIRKSLEDADKVKREMEQIETKCRELLAQADAQAKEIVNRSRKAAQEAVKVIEEKSRSETQIMLENAKREILQEKEKASADLKQECVRIAITLASELIHKNLDEKKNREFVDELIEEI